MEYSLRVEVGHIYSVLIQTLIKLDIITLRSQNILSQETNKINNQSIKNKIEHENIKSQNKEHRFLSGLEPDVGAYMY